MDPRNPFSKGFKKLKRKFAGGGRRRKRDGRSGNETDQGESDVEGSEASQRNSRLHPEVEDVESGPSREGNDVGGEEVGRMINPPASTPSTPHSGEPNSMRITLSHWLLPLIASSGNMDTSAAPGHLQEALSPDQSKPEHEINPADPSFAPSNPSISQGAESGGITLSAFPQPLPGTVSSGNTNNYPILEYIQEAVKSSTHPLDPGAMSEEVSNQKSTASATPSVILRGVEESSNAYSPLKSVAGCLRVILDNCEVRSLLHIQSPMFTAILANGGEQTNH